jgi:hypothetical protein
VTDRCGVDRRRNLVATVDIGKGRPTACPETTGFECVPAASQLTQVKLLVAHLDKVHESLHSAVNVLPLILDLLLGLPLYSNKMPGQDMVLPSTPILIHCTLTIRTFERTDSVVQQTKHTELWKQMNSPE